MPWFRRKPPRSRFDGCPDCRVRLHGPCSQHKALSKEWFAEVREETAAWDESRRLAFERRWEAHERHLPPRWDPPSGHWDNSIDATLVGPLPRIGAEKAAELARRSAVYGRPVLHPAAPRSTRGQVEAMPSAGAYLSALATQEAGRGTWANRLERFEAQALTGEARKWATREALALMPYRPGLAAATLEAVGELSLACDCWMLAGDIEGAAFSVESAPDHLLPLQQRTNLRRILGWEISPADLARLASLGSKLTPFGKAREPEILDFVVANAAALLGLDDESTALEHFFQSPTLEWRRWQFTALGGWLDRFLMAATWPDATIRSSAGELTRIVEDLFRESMGVPKVGEGWVSETTLFRELEAALAPETAVIHHGRPEGFGQQHLDVWIPEWRVGVEFQGVQHDRPVEFFGGPEAFEATRRRDATKRRKASRLGIHLIEVRPGYDLAELLLTIRSHKPPGAT